MCIQCIGMCSYCDCKNLPVISQLSREHTAIMSIAGELCRVVTAGEPSDALFDDLLAQLLAHGSYEERCLFAELRDEDDFVGTVDALCSEHSEIYGALRRVRRRGATPETLVPALDRLCKHILKEEQGLFPPVVILLSTGALERAAARV
jgi:iron-sulfur cluster repair protein YtfE (RIC family)